MIDYSENSALDTDRTVESDISTYGKPLLAIDVEAERDRIRENLTFTFKPLASKGKTREFKLCELSDRPYRQVVEEFAIAVWEFSAKLSDQTLGQYRYCLLKFCDFLDDTAGVAAPHRPATLSEFSFQLVRDYEHWLFDQRALRRSKFQEMHERLVERLATGNLPEDPVRPGCVSVAEIGRQIGCKTQLTIYQELFELIEKAAATQGLRVRSRTAARRYRRERVDNRQLALRFIETRYYSLAKVLKHILRHRPHLFPPGFVVPGFTGGGNRRRGLTKSLAPAEAEVLRSACRAALKRIRRRTESPVTLEDLAPFLILLGMSEDAPLNLAGLMGLHVAPDNPDEHCLRPSPTPRHARLYFGKPRANVDQDFVDVPDRGDLDIPGLIATLIDLTAPLRADAPHRFHNALWLYTSARDGRTVRLTSGVVSNRLLTRFIVQNDVRANGQLLLELHFRRFRPTSLSETAFTHGVAEAQRRAAHATPIQTLAYVNNPTNEPRLRATVVRASSKAIASVKAGFATRAPEAEVRQLAEALEIPAPAAREIILGRRDKLFNACVDDTNGLGPSPEGQACSEYESCLVCPNSVIVERHLPRLLTYQRFWFEQATEMPAAEWVEKHELNCAIVDDHLAKFDGAVVAEARAAVEANWPSVQIAGRRFKQT